MVMNAAKIMIFTLRRDRSVEYFARQAASTCRKNTFTLALAANMVTSASSKDLLSHDKQRAEGKHAAKNSRTKSQAPKRRDSIHIPANMDAWKFENSPHLIRRGAN